MGGYTSQNGVFNKSCDIQTQFIDIQLLSIRFSVLFSVSLNNKKIVRAKVGINMATAPAVK